MNFKQLILPSLALGATAFLLIPTKTDAFSLIGGSLSTSQRDFRIFNNFTDVSANDNTVADANWPGYTGCTMAIWKGSVEWASSLHAGNGNGDGHQAGGLGSGGANFDPVFQGNAIGVGGTNDNIHSELAGGSGGVLAFTETPISDGWRIRYYSTWSWNDNPGSSSPGIDIQGVACHEYGHALGLGHSAVSGATMFPSISGTGVVARSIAADDIAGVQAIYGVASATKPKINSVSIASGNITLTGTNFGATGNQVWFTQATAGGTGAAVMATNVSSSGGGTSITVAIPAGAGPGDVFVKLSTSGNASLSNGFPYNPGEVIGPPGTAFCFGDGTTFFSCPCSAPDTVPSPSGAPDAGCANSFDLNGAKLGATGDTNPDLVVLTCSQMPTATFSFFIKADAVDPNGAPTGDGIRCLAGAQIRFGTQTSVAGSVSYPNPGLGLVTPLSTVSGTPPGSGLFSVYQVFYRNAAPGFCTPDTFNFSNGYQITWN